MNKNLTGKQWNQIIEEEREILLQAARAIDGETGNAATEGECIVDFEGYDFSIAGKIVDDEIVINNESVFYNPAE